MRLLFLLFLITRFHTSFGQWEFLNCPKDSTKRFVLNYKLISGYYDSTSQSRILYDQRPDSSYLLKFEKTFECGINGHWKVAAVFMWSVPITQTEFFLNISRSDSLHLPFAYFMGSGGGSRYNYYATSAEGWLKGKLVSGTWFVEGDLTLFLFNSFRSQSAQQNLRIDGAFNQWTPKKRTKNHDPLFDF